MNFSEGFRKRGEADAKKRGEADEESTSSRSSLSRLYFNMTMLEGCWKVLCYVFEDVESRKECSEADRGLRKGESTLEGRKCAVQREWQSQRSCWSCPRGANVGDISRICSLFTRVVLNRSLTSPHFIAGSAQCLTEGHFATCQ